MLEKCSRIQTLGRGRALNLNAPEELIFSLYMHEVNQESIKMQKKWIILKKESLESWVGAFINSKVTKTALLSIWTSPVFCGCNVVN